MSISLCHVCNDICCEKVTEFHTCKFCSEKYCEDCYDYMESDQVCNECAESQDRCDECGMVDCVCEVGDNEYFREIALKSLNDEAWQAVVRNRYRK